ncbi:MAG: hypothetical protein OXB89_11415, partial [Anaerolineaceae bacterium]|nr:hypothetical protein [Anaerolineaceae bacterium]
KQLDAQRGDVIIFNNTSAEHRRTYDFVIRCKREAERISDIPFLLTEFQTIETARDSYWRRVGSWRLVKPYLWRTDRTKGLRYRGEIFEENVSLDTRLPNRFQRLCTDHLKVQVTRQVLAEWFSGGPATRRLGHWHEQSQLDDRELLSAFRGRSLSPEELLHYTKYARSRPFVRPSQRYRDYIDVPRTRVPRLAERAINGMVPMIGDLGVPYVGILGLRADEPKRVSSMLNRCQGDGALPYAPLYDSGIAGADVKSFWEQQEWDLEVDSRYSNCVFCFMKGKRNLNAIAQDPQTRASGPGQLSWWVEIEDRYTRTAPEVIDGKATGRESRFGFFGKNAKLSYAALNEPELNGATLQHELPCYCTD